MYLLLSRYVVMANYFFYTLYLIFLIRSNIFRHQTCRFGEIIVLYTQLVTEKFGVHGAHCIVEKVLYYCILKEEKSFFSTWHTQHTYTPDFKLYVQHEDFTKFTSLRSKDCTKVFHFKENEMSNNKVCIGY
jgi:hypothetical protein